MKNCEVIVKGLKCDADGCGYEDMSVSSDDYAEYVDAPCPKCGASLLTPEDFSSFQALEALAKLMNAVSIPEEEEEDRVNMKVNMNGSGKLEFEL